MIVVNVNTVGKRPSSIKRLLFLMADEEKAAKSPDLQILELPQRSVQDIRFASILPLRKSPEISGLGLS